MNVRKHCLGGGEEEDSPEHLTAVKHQAECLMCQFYNFRCRALNTCLQLLHYINTRAHKSGRLE